MGKKRVLNKNLQKAVQIHTEFSDKLNNESKILPSVEVIEQLLRDCNGDAEQVKRAVIFLLDDENVPSKRENRLNEADTLLSNDLIPKYKDCYTIFRDIMIEMLNDNQIQKIWQRFLEDMHAILPELSEELILHQAIDAGFAFLNELNQCESSSEEEENYECFEFEENETQEIDDRTVQQVALSLLLEQFNAVHNDLLSSRIESILIECNYDIEAATEKICSIHENGGIMNESFPDLRDGIAISKVLGKYSYNTKIVGSYKQITSIEPKSLNYNERVNEKIVTTKYKPIIIVTDNVVNNKHNMSSEKLREEALFWRNKAQEEHVVMKQKLHQIASNRYYKRLPMSEYMSESCHNNHSMINNANYNAVICILRSNNLNYQFELNSNGSIAYKGPIEPNLWKNTTIRSEHRLESIDLHGIYVKEALIVLQSIIHYYSNLTSNVTVKLVVGVGNHSANNQARLGPAILSYLNHNKYRSSSEERGCITLRLP